MDMSFVGMISVGLGLCMGAIAGYRLCKTLSRRLSSASRMPKLVKSCTWTGVILLILPSFFLSFTVGGMLGGGWADEAAIVLSLNYTIKSIFIFVGIFGGMAVVLTLSLLIGATIGGLFGMVLSKIISKYRYKFYSY